MHYLKHKKLIVLLLLLGSAIVGFGQNSINSASQSTVVNGVVHSYAIGEMTIVSTEHTTNLIVTQGFLQPEFFKQHNAGSSGNLPSVDWASAIKIYPNPTEDILFIETELNEALPVELLLYDAVGNLALKGVPAVVSGFNKFSMSLANLASGNYYLVIAKRNSSNVIERSAVKIQKLD
jgi:hypothetical protein